MVVLARISYTFISDSESNIGVYYIVLGCLGMVIVAIEVSIFYTYLFGHTIFIVYSRLMASSLQRQ